MMWLTEWRSWWGSLQPVHVFVLATPFLVAAAALIADWVRHRP